MPAKTDVSINTQLASIHQFLTIIKDQTAKTTPNRLIIAQAVDDAQRVLNQLRAEPGRQPTPVPATPGAHAGLTVADGFHFGVGFYLGVMVVGLVFLLIFVLMITIMGIVSLGGLITTFGGIQ